MCQDQALPSCISSVVHGKIRRRVTYTCTLCQLSSLPGISQVNLHLQSRAHLARELIERGEAPAEATAESDSRFRPGAVRRRRQRQFDMTGSWFWRRPGHRYLG